MKVGTVALGLAVALVGGIAPLVEADVKTEERSRFKLEGMGGRLTKMFLPKEAKEGVIATVAVKGDRMATLSEETGQIVDLAEEKVYELDVKKKTYRAKTFEQVRKEYEAAMKKTEAQMKEFQEAQQDPENPQPATGANADFETDFAVSETGQKKSILGYECKEVVSTLTMRPKGQTVEKGGGMVMTTTMWLAPKIPAMQEIAAFETRYAEKLMGPAGLARVAEQAEQMMMVFAMYPGIQQVMERSKDQVEKLDGTALMTVMTIESVRGTDPPEGSKAQKPEEPEQEEPAPTGLGGLGGMLGRKMMKKKSEPQPQQGARPAAGGRTLLLTSTTEYLKIATEASAADVQVPAGFRERGQPQ